jgi:chromate transporter
MSEAPSDIVDLQPRTVRFTDALKFWLKLGFISFGGPAGQIAVMHRELVDERRWISEHRFLHALNYCMVLPGPEAQQLATYIGWLMHRTWGGIVAGALFVLPSLFILILLSWIYVAWGDLHWVEGMFYGIKPAVTAIVIHAAHRIGSRVLKNAWLWTIAIAAFAAIAVLNLPFPLIVAGAAFAGIVGNKLAPGKFRVGTAHSATSTTHAAAIIDDDTPIPEHARFRWQRLLRIAVVGLLLWAIPMALLVLRFGWDHVLAKMGWFFTKAALLTFGGAYAVLPYVYQGAVDQHAWLTPQQMIDGLALGETTPGPLIMVVAFVGFVGGYTREWLGAEHLFLAGAIAAIVVTWFTFLPSFLLILGGGPLVESTQNEMRVTAPLTAITAAVVGVIANLALFFAWHVFWPSGFGGPVDWISIAIALAATIALLRFKQGVVPVILVCALAGFVVRLA